MLKPTILVIGDPMIDRYVYGSVSRVNPEAPSLLFDQSDKVINQAGGALNVMQLVSTLGASVKFAGPWSSNPADIKPLIKIRYMVNDTCILRVDQGKRFKQSDIDTFIKKFKAQCKKGEFNSISAIIFSDYAKGTVTSDLVKLVHRFTPTNIPVIIDTKDALSVYNPMFKSARPVYLTVNESEWNALSAGDKLKPTNTAITCGPAGIKIHTTGQVFRTDCGKVCSVVGAGDVVTAVIAVEMAYNASFECAVNIAEATASAAVVRPQTSLNIGVSNE